MLPIMDLADLKGHFHFPGAKAVEALNWGWRMGVNWLESQTPGMQALRWGRFCGSYFQEPHQVFKMKVMIPEDPLVNPDAARQDAHPLGPGLWRLPPAIVQVHPASRTGLEEPQC